MDFDFLKMKLSDTALKKIKEVIEKDGNIKWAVYEALNSSDKRGLIQNVLVQNTDLLRLLKDNREYIENNIKDLLDYLIEISEKCS